MAVSAEAFSIFVLKVSVMGVLGVMSREPSVSDVLMMVGGCVLKVVGDEFCSSAPLKSANPSTKVMVYCVPACQPSVGTKR